MTPRKPWLSFPSALGQDLDTMAFGVDDMAARIIRADRDIREIVFKVQDLVCLQLAVRFAVAHCYE